MFCCARLTENRRNSFKVASPSARWSWGWTRMPMWKCRMILRSRQQSMWSRLKRSTSTAAIAVTRKHTLPNIYGLLCFIGPHMHQLCICSFWERRLPFACRAWMSFNVVPRACWQELFGRKQWRWYAWEGTSIFQKVGQMKAHRLRSWNFIATLLTYTLYKIMESWAFSLPFLPWLIIAENVLFDAEYASAIMWKRFASVPVNYPKKKESECYKCTGK